MPITEVRFGIYAICHVDVGALSYVDDITISISCIHDINHDPILFTGRQAAGPHRMACSARHKSRAGQIKCMPCLGSQTTFGTPPPPKMQEGVRRTTTYKTITRPILQYASTISSPLASTTHNTTRVPKTTAYKRWNCQVIRPTNCLHLISLNHFLNGFLDPSQFVTTKLTHYSTMPHRPSDSSRPRQRFLLSGDVHQNPSPATKYTCSVCTSNVTSCGVSYVKSLFCLGSFEVFWSSNTAETVKLRTGHAALVVPHPLHQYRNRFHHQLQLKLPTRVLILLLSTCIFSL